MNARNPKNWTFILVAFISVALVCAPSYAEISELECAPLNSFFPDNVNSFSLQKTFRKNNFTDYQREHSFKGLGKHLNANYVGPTPFKGQNEFVNFNDLFVNVWTYQNEKQAVNRVSAVATNGDTDIFQFQGQPVMMVMDQFEGSMNGTRKYSVDVWIVDRFGKRVIEIWHSKGSMGIPLRVNTVRTTTIDAYKKIIQHAINEME